MNDEMTSVGSLQKGMAREYFLSVMSQFFPELGTALLVYAMTNFIDARFIASLQMPDMYMIARIIDTFIFFMIKIAEGFSVGAVVLCGKYYGMKDRVSLEKFLSALIFFSVCFGICMLFLLYTQSELILKLLCIPHELHTIAIPFFRIKSLTIFFIFLFFGLVGFLRGIKKTKVILKCFIIGAIIFIITDYILIFGCMGFPCCGFIGSAWASCIQYMVMSLFALWNLFWKNKENFYFIYDQLSLQDFCLFFSLSWPIILDKVALQCEKLFLVRCIGNFGKLGLGALSVLRDIEALIFIPMIACGNVATILVSNEHGRDSYYGMYQVMRILIIFAVIMTCVLFSIFYLNFDYIIKIFDPKRTFDTFVFPTFQKVGIFCLFDILQIILAGSLRGAMQVKMVMWTRIMSFLFLFIPLVFYIMYLFPVYSVKTFIFLYASFNVVNCFSSLIYIIWLRYKFFLVLPVKELKNGKNVL